MPADHCRRIATRDGLFGRVGRAYNPDQVRILMRGGIPVNAQEIVEKRAYHG
jgi:hypothetical protein